jgi:DNA-binding transcriptional MerR regulator
MQSRKIRMEKKNFRIGELAEELDVKKFVVRFWEKEFGIRSKRSTGGQRFYTEQDLKKFKKIKDLLYNKGFTIAGARAQVISSEKPESYMAAKKEPSEVLHGQQKKQQELLKELQKLKADLLAFKKVLI